MHRDCFDQTFLAEGLGQVLVGTDQFAACAVEQTVLAGQHDNRSILEFGVVFNERASLVTVQARHHDIDEDDIGLVVDHLGQAVEAILSQNDLAARL